MVVLFKSLRGPLKRVVPEEEMLWENYPLKFLLKGANIPCSVHLAIKLRKKLL